MVSALKLVLGAYRAEVLVASVAAVAVAVADQPDVNAASRSAHELLYGVALLFAAWWLVAAVLAVRIPVTHRALLDARPVTAAMHGGGVTAAPPRLVAPVPAISGPVANFKQLNTRSVFTGVVERWVAGTPKFVRLIRTVDYTVAPNTLVKAGSVVAAEIEGLVTGTVAVEFVRLIRAVVEAVAVLLPVDAVPGSIGTRPLADMITRQRVWQGGVKTQAPWLVC